ncbi:MAG TPA: hypothetical protein VEF89_05515 [Solirubrobacteraceae bacterium]|nr:hypothetical protein [Solirubrobacteraceae bacterium]
MSGRESPPPEEEAHDVLAAEAFAVPTADPSLRHHPITLPDDPSGIAEPHDVLAAEEFAMPASRQPSAPTSAAGRIVAKARSPVRIAVLAAVALGLLRALRRRRRHAP